MLEKIRKEMEVYEENSIRNTKLYIREIPINEESYETKIMQEESILGILKFQVIYEGEEKALLYDVSNTISLREYLKRHFLTKEELCKIIVSIDDLLSNIENYLISENSISLDTRLIRVLKKQNDTFDLKFILIPNQKADFSFELSRFLASILNKVDTKDKNAINLSFGLFVKSSKDHYTINDLMDVVHAAKINDKSTFKEMGIDVFSEYDEKTIDESYDEIVESDVIDPVPELSEFIDAEKSMDPLIDTKTKEILNDELFDKFDDEPVKQKVEKNVIKFKKKLFNIKPKKVLNAHINMALIKNLIIPIMCALVPMAFYAINGNLKFSKSIPIIVLCEIVIITMFVINNIIKQGGEERRK